MKYKGIALLGGIGSGKDIVAHILSSNFNTGDIVRVAFADAIKEYCTNIFGESNRNLNIAFGMAMRKIKEDVWIQLVSNDVSDLIRCGAIPVITDVRFPNEYDWCKENGFMLVRVNCFDDIRIQRIRKRGDEMSIHRLLDDTETMLDGYPVNFEIDNSGTLEDLKIQLHVLKDVFNRGSMCV